MDVTTEASTYKYTAKDRVTNCNQQDYEIGVQNLIVAKLTKGQGTFVWTRNPASIDERLAIINIIKSINGFDNNATLDNCYFYSGEGIEGTMIFRGAKIRYDCQNILHFDYPKQLQQEPMKLQMAAMQKLQLKTPTQKILRILTWLRF